MREKPQLWHSSRGEGGGSVVQADAEAIGLKTEMMRWETEQTGKHWSLASAKVLNPSLSDTQPRHPPCHCGMGLACVAFSVACFSPQLMLLGSTKIFLKALMNPGSLGTE